MTNQSVTNGQRICVWRFSDGKPGHESQSQGLVEAMARVTKVDVHDVYVRSRWKAIGQYFLSSYAPGSSLPRPDYIIGAGHATHWEMLAAKRSFGGKVVVLMKPSLPISLFDFAVIPEHDDPPSAENVISTCGVLNTMRPSGAASIDQGLILLGGPSKHHDWDVESVMSQLRGIISTGACIRWRLTTSRRTPQEMLDCLKRQTFQNLEVIPFEQTKPGWVRERLDRSTTVWVSEDSMSMIFESLSAGAEVGLIRVPRKKRSSRVFNAVDSLSQKGYIRFSDQPKTEARERVALAEAERVAELIIGFQST